MTEADGTGALDVPHRRLSDLIVSAFFQARDRGYEATAEHLHAALDSLAKYESELYPNDRRLRVDLNGATSANDKPISVSVSAISHNPTSTPQIIGGSTKGA